MDSETRTFLEQIIIRMDAGFGDVNARFAEMDTRFADIDARMHRGFAVVYNQMDTGFGDVYARIARTDGRIEALHAEMHEGFRSIDERLTSLERHVNSLWFESKNHTAAILGITERVASLEKRVDSMSDDMRQRFRVVIERIAALEPAA